MQAGLYGHAAHVVRRADHQHQGRVERFAADLAPLVVQHLTEALRVDPTPYRTGPIPVRQSDIRDYQSRRDRRMRQARGDRNTLGRSRA